MYVYMRAAGHSNYTRRWEERSFLLSLSLRSRETSIARSVDFYVFLEAMRCSKGTRMPVVTAPSSNLHREVR